MTTKQIYELSVQLGVKSDLRGEARVKKQLAKLKDRHKEMRLKDKEEFDIESLSNPYSDSRVLYSNDEPVKTVLAGIDIGGAEILLAKQLGFDLVISHHPHGVALAGLHDVMSMQAEILADYGVPINIAQSLIKFRISEVSRRVSPGNHNQIVDIARVSGIDFMCAHTPADNLAAEFLVDLYEKNKNKLDTVSDLMDLLKTVPEYQEAIKMKSGPKIFVGTPESYLGKVVFTEITGGTSGSKDVYEKMSQYGIGTIVGMHMSEEHRAEAEKHHINVIIAGHMSSDSLGMNLLLDEIEKKGIKVLPIGGLMRIRRYKGKK
jgi:putative NIF3 family GTP cyclohydrolase 1 type 2